MPGQDSLEYFKTIPVGYRFQPTDEELIHHYLSKKDKGETLPLNKIIPVNIYNYNPGELAEIYKEFWEKEWYFFTPRERKYLNGERPRRDAGNGFWKASGADTPIMRNDQCIGLKKALVFYEKNADIVAKTNWIMHEYRLPKPPTITGNKKRKNNDMKLDNWVLCRIYKKSDRPPSTSRRRSNTDSGHDHHQRNESDEPNSRTCEEYQSDHSTLMCNEDHCHQRSEANSVLEGTKLENDQDRSLITNALDNFRNIDQSQVPLFNGHPQQQHQQLNVAYTGYINMTNCDQEVQPVQEQETTYDYINIKNFGKELQQVQEQEMGYNCINMDNYNEEEQVSHNYINIDKYKEEELVSHNYVNMDNYKEEEQVSHNYVNMDDMKLQSMLSCNYGDNYSEEQYALQVLGDFGNQNYPLPLSYSTADAVPYQDHFSLLPPGSSHQHSMDNSMYPAGVFKCNHEEDTSFHP